MSLPDRPLDRDLTKEESRTYVEALAERPELWRHLVRHDPDERIFIPLERDGNVETWLICWMPGHDTGFHDHDLSSGAVTVIEGQVREHRLTFGGEPISRVVPAGGQFTFDAPDIHRVTHEGTEPSVTLHVYSPPLRRMGRYVVQRDAPLERHPLGKDEELRPLEGAA